MTFCFFLLASSGLTIVICESKITKRFRKAVSRHQFFGDMVKCCMCTGFWVGLGVSTYMMFTGAMPKNFYMIPFYGFAGSFTSYTASLLQNFLENYLKGVNAGG